MDLKEKEQQQSNQHNQSQSPYPPLYSASAPTDFPTPPPQYSAYDPSFSQQPKQQLQAPFLQHQQQLPIQQQPQLQQVVVVQIPLQRNPVNTTCLSCHANIVTRVTSEANITTHTAALILCLVCLPCFWVPYCVSSCQSSVHSCPNCSAHIGSYRN